MKGKFFKLNKSENIFEIISYPVLDKNGEFVVFVRDRITKKLETFKLDLIEVIEDEPRSLMPQQNTDFGSVVR